MAHDNNTIGAIEAFAGNEAILGIAPAHSITQDMQAMTDTWTSIDMENATPAQKAMVMRGLLDPDEQISEFINKTIEITHVLAQYVDIANDESGEIQTAPRVVLFDAKGTSYACVSRGIQTAIAQIINVYGQPPFNPPLKVKVVQKAVKRGSMLTLVPVI